MLSEHTILSPGQLVQEQVVQLLAKVDNWRYVPALQWHAADEESRAAAAARFDARRASEEEVDLTPMNVADDY